MKYLYLILSLLLFNFYSYSQNRTISESTKKIVYARDIVCQCCGSSESLEYDHITPYSCGDSNDASNIQLLCQKCNRSKSNSCYCKIHNRKVGTNCCDGSSTKTNSSSSTLRQCTGTTKKGTRCKNKTTNSNGRCYLHCVKK